MSKRNNMNEDLELAMKELNKKMGLEVVTFAGKANLNPERIPTGSLTLDWATGGGIPLKRITELYGPYSSGKTLIAMRVISHAQKMGLPAIFVDAEESFHKSHAVAAGIDIDELIFVQSSKGEKMFDTARFFMKKFTKGVIVIDSVAALVPEYEEENDMTKQTMGLTARLMSKGLRILNGANQEWAIIFINQIREKIGVMYGNPETTTGGRALPFFATLRIHVKSGEPFYNGDVRIGQEIKFKVEKSKIGIPFRTGSLKYFYETGFDEMDDIISLALLLNIIQQAGAWYKFKDQSFQGRKGIEEACKEDPQIYTQIKNAVTSSWTQMK